MCSTCVECHAASPASSTNENADRASPNSRARSAGTRPDATGRDAVRERRLAERRPHLLASTVVGKLAPRDLVEWVLADRLPVRVQLQTHKYVWPPDAMGV